MAKRLTFSVPHRYSRGEALARIAALGDYFTNKHDAVVTWRGDAVDIVARYMLVPIEATTTVTDTAVSVDGKDPGFLLRGRALAYLQGKVEMYLDPGTSLDQLPRE